MSGCITSNNDVNTVLEKILPGGKVSMNQGLSSEALLN
jgi:hypothetical protein